MKRKPAADIDADAEARALEALEAARRMSPGPARSAALKEASKMRLDASMKRWIGSKELTRPSGDRPG